MNVPDILGVEVITPDGRGSVLSLHHGRVIVHLNKIERGQIMNGSKRDGGLCIMPISMKMYILLKGNITLTKMR